MERERESKNSGRETVRLQGQGFRDGPGEPLSPLPPQRGVTVLPETERRAPAPGQQAVVLAMLAIGIMLMGIQLWLLTVALDLYLAGEGDRVWWLAFISGLIFLGGLLVLRLLGRRPRIGGRSG